MTELPIGLQTYTVRDHLSADYEGTLSRVAQMGYRYLEIGGFGPYSVSEWRDVLNRLDLRVCSNHVQIEMLEESFNHIAEFNQAIGNSRLVCPYLREERRGDAEDYRRTARSLNQIGARCADKGFSFFYHNHAFEFSDLGGICGFDILTGETDPALVQFEVDAYWVRFGGRDPAETIRSLAGRCELIHLKDMDAENRKVFREVGEGILDFKEIFEAALEAGAKVFIVEQDVCPEDSLTCAGRSMKNIARLWEVSEHG